ncbi:MAG: hypothetical protein HYZ21_10200 [Chloroflexi bacterium]|nr:hypothetical protein [Chloroflexota bacterium]
MKLSKGLKITALVLMGLAAAFFTFMGVGEMLGGDLSGMGHLPPVVLIVLLMWLGWRKPMAGGITMFLLGVLIGVYFFSLMNSTEIKMVGVLLMSGPFILPGLLFLAAGVVERPRQAQNT